MFLETKRDGETITGPTFSGFVTWLEQQPINGRYDYDCSDCCLFQYGQSVGAMKKFSPLLFNRLHDTVLRGRNEIVARRPWTFGAALARARVAHAEGAGD